MIIETKDDSVRVGNLHDAMYTAICGCRRVWTRHGLKKLTITSGRDGKHRKNSKHYSGEALDLRIWEMADPKLVASDLADELGPDFDVILEKTHIHVEHDPKT